MSTNPMHVLVVDDNRSAAEAIALLLEREGLDVDACFDGRTAIERLAAGGARGRPYDLVLTDLRMEPIDGLGVVRAARRMDPPVNVMVFTAFGSVDAAVEAMRLGALDFLTKPVTAEQLLRRVRALSRDSSEVIDFIGGSDATHSLLESAKRLAEVRSTVLLIGETGVGRTHLARWLHAHGPDADRPFLVLRSGEVRPKEELAAAGTLLLPGIDHWEERAQVTVLRQLEELEVGQPPRLVATASPDIEARASEGLVRPELYFRLAVLVLRVPPLRERPKDIGPLLDYFLDQTSQAFAKEQVRPSAEQLSRLEGHAWTGNVRELGNLAERAVVMGPSAFNMNIKAPTPTAAAVPALSEGFQLTDHLEDTERTLLIRAIEQTGGDRPEMCRLLGLERNTLRYKLNKYNLLDRLQ